MRHAGGGKELKAELKAMQGHFRQFMTNLSTYGLESSRSGEGIADRAERFDHAPSRTTKSGSLEPVSSGRRFFVCSARPHREWHPAAPATDRTALKTSRSSDRTGLCRLRVPQCLPSREVESLHQRPRAVQHLLLQPYQTAGLGRRTDVYVVEPEGPFADAPNATDRKFPGNLTESSRTLHPLQIVSEVED